jgi:hypothetical protein
MFGKVIGIGTNLQHAFNVYQIRRFPSTKLPLFSINMTIIAMLILARRVYWNIRANQLNGLESKSCLDKKCDSKNEKKEIRWISKV